MEFRERSGNAVREPLEKFDRVWKSWIWPEHGAQVDVDIGLVLVMLDCHITENQDGVSLWLEVDGCRAPQSDGEDYL